MMTAIIAVCSWLSLPIMTVPVTLQTFAIFLTLLICSGRNGTVSILVFILLGLVGVPVFSGFKSGPSALFGPTGGYIIGFLVIGIIFYISEKLISESLKAKVISLIAGLIACYTFGTLWFVTVYNAPDTSMDIKSAVSVCVLPFILPDLLKLALAVILYRILKPSLEKTAKNV